MRFSSPSRSLLEHPRFRFTGSCSPGFFFAPSAHQASEIHGRPGYPFRLPSTFSGWDSARSSQIFRLRYRSQAFSTSQRFPSLQRRPTIFRQVTLLGFRPSGVFPSAQLRTAHRRQLALLTFLPRSDASVLSGSFLGHVPFLRSNGHAIRRLQGLRPREN